MLDWCDDLAELADHLDVDRFPVMAISGGGLYAAACGWRLSSRVIGLGLFSVIGPLEAPGAKQEMNLPARIAYLLAARAPRLMRRLVRSVCRAATRRPKKMAARLERTRPAEDVEVIRRPEVRRVLLENLQEQFRDPDTIRCAALAGPLEEIDVPTHIWQGGRDTVHTPLMAHYLAARIPGAN